MIRFLGIFRELLHSPNRETDDAKVLQAVAYEMTRLGAAATTMDVEPALRALEGTDFDVVSPMCEALPTLRRLLDLPGRGAFVNTPEAVLNCYRTRMVETLEACPEALHPQTVVRPVRGALEAPAFMDGIGMWVKRGDVHNTCDRDVVRVMDLEDFKRVRDDFTARGIDEMVLQEHHDGDLIKFYGVGPGKWFTWFYHDPLRARKIPFDPNVLDEQTAAVAGAVGLEVFGGDAIVTPEGPIRVIDINSWPSFARVRHEASIQIARHLIARAGEAESIRAVKREAVR